MERLEMIEKLRERANVSYEEARDALDQANNDMLEAIVILEKQGKIKEDKINENVKAAEGKAKSIFGTIKGTLRSGWRFLRHTAFHVTRNGKEIFVMPSLIFALLVFCFFYTIVPVMLIAMFFNVRYHFTGSEDTEKANDVLSKAGNIADGVKNAAESMAAEGTSGE